MTRTSTLVGVCYRHWVAVYKVTGGDTFSSAWRLPSSAGLAAMCWLGEDVVTALTADLQWGWAALSPGHYPRSVLAAERTQLHSLDTRSGASVRLGLGLGAAGTCNHIRAVDSGAGLAGHNYYGRPRTRGCCWGTCAGPAQLRDKLKSMCFKMVLGRMEDSSEFMK